MKNKKGFTLVELLAIIVILAVIMVIAVPQILNVVNGSKNGAWKNNVSMIERGIVKNANLLNPETGAYDYSIDKLCSNPSLLSKVVKVEDTNITCSGNVFTLMGTGQFANKSATITCNNSKCSLEILADIGTVDETKFLKNMILVNNSLITSQPTLTTSSNNTSDQSGLYALDVTNGFGGINGTTYYFRGNVTNNYVSFANDLWRIVRINEDGTVRLVYDSQFFPEIDGREVGYNSDNGQDSVYFSNSLAKSWLMDEYIPSFSESDRSKLATGNYFCEAAKVGANEDYLTVGFQNMLFYANYTPNLTCETDANGKGLVNTIVGLLTYDEVVLAGGYPTLPNSDFWLNGKVDWCWTMSPNGYLGYSSLWYVHYSGDLSTMNVPTNYALRPVVNLKANVTATGTGIESDPYVIE